MHAIPHTARATGVSERQVVYAVTKSRGCEERVLRDEVVGDGQCLWCGGGVEEEGERCAPVGLWAATSAGRGSWALGRDPWAASRGATRTWPLHWRALALALDREGFEAALARLQ